MVNEPNHRHNGRKPIAGTFHPPDHRSVAQALAIAPHSDRIQLPSATRGARRVEGHTRRRAAYRYNYGHRYRHRYRADHRAINARIAGRIVTGRERTD